MTVKVVRLVHCGYCRRRCPRPCIAARSNQSSRRPGNPRASARVLSIAARPAEHHPFDPFVALPADSSSRHQVRRRARATTAISPAVTEIPGTLIHRRLPSAADGSSFALIKPAIAVRGDATQMRASRTDRTDRVLSIQRLADDAAGKRRRGRVGPAGTHGDRRQPQRSAVDESLARVVGDQQFADRLFDSVRRLRIERGRVVEHVGGSSPPNTATELVNTMRGRLPAARHSSSSVRVASTLMRMPRSKSASAMPLTIAAR